MIDLKNDPITWDLVVQNGDLQLAVDSDAVAQFLAQRIKLFLGEYYLDLTEGTPYYQEIFVKNPNVEILQQVLKDRVTGTTGIVELLSLDLSLDNPTRVLTCTINARTKDGPISVSVSQGG